MKYSLYYSNSCPYCHRVLRAADNLALNIELRNVQSDSTHRRALQKGGGRVMVPCLRIEDAKQEQWMYESADIIRYLSNAS